MVVPPTFPVGLTKDTVTVLPVSLRKLIISPGLNLLIAAVVLTGLAIAGSAGT